MKKYVVRYGALRYLGVMSCSDSDAAGFGHGVKVVARTERGLEAATILCEATKERIEKLKKTREPIAFIRRLAKEDEERLEKIKANERRDFDRCLKIIRRAKLEMTLVRVERILGGERVVAYYVAEGRVDFRELVRALAAEFQTRIEMKQIGARDETKLRDYVGDCGRELCCQLFLTTPPPVSMRMAKLQKATLDPTKVSGRCARLKCCLRFEYDTYCEMQAQTPPLEAIVMTPDGRGKVVAQELLARKVVVALDEGKRATFDADAVSVVSCCNGRRARRAARRGDSDGLEETRDDDGNDARDALDGKKEEN